MSFSLSKPNLRNIQITNPDILQSKVDLKANLVTFATTAADGCLCYASNEDKQYVVRNGALVEMINSSTAEFNIGNGQIYKAADGKVGIGTSSPLSGYRLDIRDAEAKTNLQSTTGTNAVYSRFTNTGGDLYFGRDNSAGSAFGSGGYSSVIYSAGAYPFAVNINGTERMRIDSSGNVGIGTSSPSARLDITADALGNTAGNERLVYRSTINTGNNDQLDILYRRTTSTGGWSNADLIIRRNVDSTASQSQIVLGGGNFTSFWTSATERMRIDSSGNVGIGNATLVTDARVTITRPQGVANEAPLGLVHGTYSHRIGPNSNGAFLVYRASDNVGVYLISGNTAWSATSDERNKDIIEPIIDGLNKVSSLRSVIGKYKHDEVGMRRSFLIAQDVQAVLPEAINIQSDEDGTLGLTYTDLIPLLVSALKDVKVELDAAKARILALENA
jgi:hypothetical protein